MEIMLCTGWPRCNRIRAVMKGFDGDDKRRKLSRQPYTSSLITNSLSNPDTNRFAFHEADLQSVIIDWAFGFGYIWATLHSGKNCILIDGAQSIQYGSPWISLAKILQKIYLSRTVWRHLLIAHLYTAITYWIFVPELVSDYYMNDFSKRENTQYLFMSVPIRVDSYNHRLLKIQRWQF